MPITNYSELKTAIANWLNRDDLTSVIPDFISMAEASMTRDIRHWRQEKRSETTLDEQYEDIPSDYLETVELTINNDRKITLISTAEMQRRKEASSATGEPKYYRLVADQFEFFPSPDGSYTLSLQYLARTSALSDSDTSNWIIDYAPDVYLYGSLIHAAPYLVDDPRIQVWGSLYAGAVAALNKESEDSKFSGPLRIGVPR